MAAVAAGMATCSSASLLSSRPLRPPPPLCRTSSSTSCSTSYSVAPCLPTPSPLARRLRCSPRCMAPEDEKMTRRSPLDFPIEWERPRPGRRPDVFPQFSPMKTPLPQPPPTDPPEEDEEEEEKKEEEKPEEEPEKPRES